MEALYQLIDNYSLFYFKFISQNTEGDTNFWSANYNTSVHNSWAGLAYEMVCLQHLEQIKTALGISGVICHAHSWIYKSESDKGAQIDLLIDRADDVINLCEIKYSKDKFTIDEEEDEKLRHRESAFVREIQTTKTIHTTMITTYGLTDGGHASDIHNQVTMNDLFD